MVNQLLTRSAIMDLEDPACAVSNSAELALEYITPILFDLKKSGLLPEHKFQAAGYALEQLATEATRLYNATYSVALMAAAANEAMLPTGVSGAVKALSEELRIEWALSTVAEDAGHDEQIETRQRDRVQDALKALEALVKESGE